MGQFKQDVESYNPPVLNRAMQVVIPLAFIVKAAVNQTFEDFLWAAWLVVLMLPFGIAPKATLSRVTAWNRNQPILSGTFTCVLMTSGTFLLLRFFMNRPHSILIAIPLTVVLMLISRLVGHRSTQSR
jgi:hypothetical protein